MNNKTIGYVIGLVVLALVVVGIAVAVKKNKPDVAQHNPVSMCYIWNTEAGDHADLRLDISGNTVTGAFNFMPAEKDSKTGSFAGSVGSMNPATSSRTADVVWNASAEGATNQEQLLIEFGEGTAAAGFGAMKQNSSGVWVYANPANISYAPTLQQVDCSDPGMRPNASGKLPAGSSANGDVSKLTANAWVWVATNRAAGTDVTPKKPGAFTITFASDGRMSGTTDCNSFGGTYTANGMNVSFGNLTSTLMYCDGSQESVFTGFLSTVKSYEIDASGTLVLKLANSDTMAFRKK